jgi:WD40-like Beta Propeller Repeat
MWLRSTVVRIVLPIVGAVALGAVCPAVSEASFPGQNGQFAVQLASGGIALVAPDGSSVTPLCAPAGDQCRSEKDPVWSADGRELAFVDDSIPVGDPARERGALSIVYPDGSCLFCLVGAGSTASGSVLLTAVRTPAFRPDGELSARIHFYTAAPRVETLGVDGVRYGTAIAHGSEPAWSSTGRLAVVLPTAVKKRRKPHHQKKKHPGSGRSHRHIGRRDASRSAAGNAVTGHPYLAITDATGRHLRPLTKFAVTSPDWSPDSRQLVGVVAGEVVLINLQGKIVARLARGSSPVFSPDGSRIAFIAAGGQLQTISVHGGAPTDVGTVHAVTVDWQPLPAEAPALCTPVAGSKVVQGTSTVLITADTPRVASFVGGTSYMACDLSTGRWRHLYTNSDETNDEGYDNLDLDKTAVAGDYVAYGVVQMFDLKGDQEIGETAINVINAGTGAPGISSHEIYDGVLTQLFVSAAGYPVWQSYSVTDDPVYDTRNTIEADTGSGAYLLDTGQSATPAASVLGNLAVNGELVTWTHSGVSMSAALQGPTG